MSLAKIPEVYVVSDSLGETAESVAKATISQFDEDIDIIRVPFIRHAEQIQKVIDEAASHNAVVCHTLVSRELRETFEKIADAKGVRYVDILGPMMDTVGTITTTKPRMKPGIIHKLDEEYFKKVEAIEFAVKYDDGKNPAGFAKADVVLLGVSPYIQDTACPCTWHTRNSKWQTCRSYRKYRFRKKSSTCRRTV